MTIVSHDNSNIVGDDCPCRPDNDKNRQKDKDINKDKDKYQQRKWRLLTWTGRRPQWSHRGRREGRGDDQKLPTHWFSASRFPSLTGPIFWCTLWFSAGPNLNSEQLFNFVRFLLVSRSHPQYRVRGRFLPRRSRHACWWTPYKLAQGWLWCGEGVQMESNYDVGLKVGRSTCDHYFVMWAVWMEKMKSADQSWYCLTKWSDLQVMGPM